MLSSLFTVMTGNAAGARATPAGKHASSGPGVVGNLRRHRDIQWASSLKEETYVPKQTPTLARRCVHARSVS